MRQIDKHKKHKRFVTVAACNRKLFAIKKYNVRVNVRVLDAKQRIIFLD